MSTKIQDAKITELEKQGFVFSGWVCHGDDNEYQHAVMMKKMGRGNAYLEIDQDGEEF